jgi:hypothetical protein
MEFRLHANIAILACRLDESKAVDKDLVTDLYG